MGFLNFQLVGLSVNSVRIPNWYPSRKHMLLSSVFSRSVHHGNCDKLYVIHWKGARHHVCVCVCVCAVVVFAFSM